MQVQAVIRRWRIALLPERYKKSHSDNFILPWEEEN